MHLTKRFFMMNVLTVLVSIGLTVLAVIVFTAGYTKVFGRQEYSQEMKRVFEARTALNEIKRTVQDYKFEELLDSHVQQQLALRVQAIGGSALLFKDREAIFSTREFTDVDKEKSLLLTGGPAAKDTVEIDGQVYLFTRAAYKLASGEDGVLLLLAPVKLNTSFYWVLGVFTVGFFLLSFLAMNFWVSYTFSKGIIMPVSRLKDAAVRISQGDLDGGISEEGEGEVRELSRTLEFMRIKLKESIYLQQKYDENRTFLVSSISHDLKTPVTSIKGYIEGIMDGVAQTPEKMQDYLETARSKAVLVNTMIDDLLLYSKLDLNQLPYHFEHIDLVQYFEDCVADYQYELEKAHIRLELIAELSGAITVSIDRERLKRVIQNILDNAVKYLNKKDGRISVILRETRTSAIIEIQDNGQGIPEQDLPHIFDRFYRADPSRRNAGGSGLGLAIAKQIVEGHDGKIWARSTFGEGTRMMISLKKV